MKGSEQEHALFLLLEEKYHAYNRPDFIESDPISIPHQFSRKEDIEISGLLAALIAWGKRKTIIDNSQRLMALMEGAPYAFVMDAGEREMKRLTSFVHRTFNGQDCQALVYALRSAYRDHQGLEGLFTRGLNQDAATVKGGILSMRQALIHTPGFPRRTHKHLANPDKGSSAKRINMFLRWMVRTDRNGVDFGLWPGIRPDQLVCPLDIHTGKVARKLGLLERKQNDWKAAVALTEALKRFSPEDPVKYDFSLFGMGVHGELL